MLVTAPGQTIEIPFVYRDGYDYVDPTTNITIFLKRGYNSAGASILGPYTYNITQALAASPNTIQKWNLRRKKFRRFIYSLYENSFKYF
jgi:hypothetical protein